MSSPEYAEMRGIPGTAVAAKAQLYPEARKRGLLFFLQSLSLKHCGLRKVGHDLIAGFVSLSGITQKTGFFQKLATAIGLAASKRKATDMQVKVEEFFRKTRLMLVIDEAHYLWPQHERSHSNPELVDWVNTALVNQKVPVALICTDQFAKLKARVEKQTGWTSEQLGHRVKRYKKLSSTPTKADLEAVASKRLAMRWNSD